ncbi:MAG: proton-conducting transporter membrane subunit [Bacteroidia bacterium]|nr:proton-conducting transporter membrane subunit [Bacteroidia bacterium]
MWGIEWLWPELILLGAGLGNRWRVVPPVLILGYGIALYTQRYGEALLLSFTPEACRMILLFCGLSSLAWIMHPLRGAAAWALLLQLGSYSLLLRSRHLAFTWTLLESGAIAGYFFVVGASSSAQKWAAGVRYFSWSVAGSALILMGIAARLMGEVPLSYPLASGRIWSDSLLSIGWAIKVGFIPWHFWLMGIYRCLPVVWGGWFAVVPKGALLLNLISGIPSAGLSLELFYMCGALSLLSAYAWAWKAESLTEMVFWGSFAQGGYVVLAATREGASAAWDFWAVYGGAGFLGLLYAEAPWQGRGGSSIGLLLLANLAALPPVLGFWVKFQLFWVGLNYLTGGLRWLLIGSALLATLGGFAVYGKVLWRLWTGEAAPVPSLSRKILYSIGALGLFVLGLNGL